MRAIRARGGLRSLGWLAISLSIGIAVGAVAVEHDQLAYMGLTDVLAVVLFCGPLCLLGLLSIGLARRDVLLSWKQSMKGVKKKEGEANF
jgi:hypothetical protein